MSLHLDGFPWLILLGRLESVYAWVTFGSARFASLLGPRRLQNHWEMQQRRYLYWPVLLFIVIFVADLVGSS